MDSAEIEFLAETESIKIVPNFSHGVIYLFQGDIGPFRAGIPLEVPVWLGLNLRQRQKCRLVQPSWMNPQELTEIKEKEKESQFFTPMPVANAFVLTQLILDVATSDLSESDEIRTILKDIWDIRQSKLRKSVDAFVRSGMLHAKLDHLHLIELNTVRPLLPATLDQINRLEMASAIAQYNSDSSRSFSNNTLY
ncbi:GINS2 [Lepeophtheirus salmonis]|uniref:DNA replication complex GINS protein PSF2 n=1 Tax=Lepeophtheirus salmonis TaxID=72036 RepID=A0A0K2TB66_LEPSM|nr:DNA replication complex GINS protein PSF2-like [Lepeophtheirus salmonis]CAB4055709.1 GINS2 [Lepeophtheirus salmonis]CAF2779740.1 GINS2 [Lepeophtheirus salmonis]